MLLDNSASIARCPSCSRSKAIGAVRCRLYCRYYDMICKDIDSGVQRHSSFVNGKYRPGLCWVFPALSPRVHDIFLPTSVVSSSWRCQKRPWIRVLNGSHSKSNRQYVIATIVLDATSLVANKFSVVLSTCWWWSNVTRAASHRRYPQITDFSNTSPYVDK